MPGESVRVTDQAVVESAEHRFCSRCGRFSTFSWASRPGWSGARLGSQALAPPCPCLSFSSCSTRCGPPVLRPAEADGCLHRDHRLVVRDSRDARPFLGGAPERGRITHSLSVLGELRVGAELSSVAAERIAEHRIPRSNNSMQLTALRAAADAGRLLPRATGKVGKVPLLSLLCHRHRQWLFRSLELGIVRRQPSALSDASKHSSPNLLVVMKGEDDVRPVWSNGGLVGIGLSFLLPANSRERREDTPGLGG